MQWPLNTVSYSLWSDYIYISHLIGSKPNWSTPLYFVHVLQLHHHVIRCWLSKHPTSLVIVTAYEEGIRVQFSICKDGRSPCICPPAVVIHLVPAWDTGIGTSHWETLQSRVINPIWMSCWGRLQCTQQSGVCNTMSVGQWDRQCLWLFIPSWRGMSVSHQSCRWRCSKCQSGFKCY